MNKSPFRKLPAEVRCMIWDAVFEANGAKRNNRIVLQMPKVTGRGRVFLGPLPLQTRTHLTITEACKQIRAESFSTLFLGAEVQAWIYLEPRGSWARNFEKRYVESSLIALKRWRSTVPCTHKIGKLSVLARCYNTQNPPKFPLWETVNSLLPTSSLRTLLPAAVIVLELQSDHERHPISDIHVCAFHKRLWRNLDFVPGLAASSLYLPLGDQLAAQNKAQDIIKQSRQALAEAIDNHQSECIAVSASTTGPCKLPTHQRDVGIMQLGLFDEQDSDQGKGCKRRITEIRGWNMGE